VIGFHGRLRPWHGFEMLVDVCDRLLQHGRDIHLLVVGEGEFDALNRLPDDRYSRIEWQPHHEIPKYVAAFDVLPLTYQADMPCYFSPLKLMEAMACGVVPLVPDLGDLPTVVDHQRTGLVYRAGDGDQLFAQLDALIDDRILRTDIGSQAAALARQHSWTNIAALALASSKQQQSPMSAAMLQVQTICPDLQQVRRVAIDRDGHIQIELHQYDGAHFFEVKGDSLRRINPGKDRRIPLATRLDDPGFSARHTLISYRPGRRMVLASTGGQAETFLKAYKERRVGIAAERHRLAMAANRSGGFDVPELLHVALDEDYFVMAELPGQSPPVNADAADIWQEIGRRLRHFQQSSLARQLEMFDYRHELAVLDERARRYLLCIDLLPEAWPVAREMLTEIAARLPPSETGMAHRDLHDRQFITGDNYVGLLDFDLLGHADVALDPGNLLAHMQLRALQQGQDPMGAGVEACDAAFLDGLNRQQQTGFLQHLLFYRASTLLRLALLYAIRPRWSHLTPALIKQGQHHIAELNKMPGQV